jgi:hypothetical protein
LRDVRIDDRDPAHHDPREPRLVGLAAVVEPERDRLGGVESTRRRRCNPSCPGPRRDIPSGTMPAPGTPRPEPWSPAGRASGRCVRPTEPPRQADTDRIHVGRDLRGRIIP